MVRLLIALAALSAAPEAVIDGDDEVMPGDLVVLSAAGSTADPGGLVWILGNSDRKYLEVNGGRDLVFASGTPGKYKFFLVAVGADEGKVLWSRAAHTVTIAGPTPPPAPIPPPPGPTPPGPLPDGPLGLVKASRDGLARVTDRTGQASLAAAQRAHASAVAAGAFPDAASILAGWRAANNGAVTATTWAPWGQTVTPAIQSVYATGRLKSNADWSAAFVELAQGLGG